MHVPPFLSPVDNWSEELVAIETKVKEEANILLFVIDQQTRSVTQQQAAQHTGAAAHTIIHRDKEQTELER